MIFWLHHWRELTRLAEYWQSIGRVVIVKRGGGRPLQWLRRMPVTPELASFCIQVSKRCFPCPRVLSKISNTQSPIAGSMLFLCLRRWPVIEPTMGECLTFSRPDKPNDKQRQTLLFYWSVFGGLTSKLDLHASSARSSRRRLISSGEKKRKDTLSSDEIRSSGDVMRGIMISASLVTTSWHRLEPNDRDMPIDVRFWRILSS